MLRLGLPLAALAITACTDPAPAEFPPLAAKPAAVAVAAPVTSDDPLDALGLTAEEKAIWPTLTREQQTRAVQFIRAGSTLTSSLGS